MTRIEYQFEPLAAKSPYKHRKASPFRASFDDTMDLLDRELGRLRAKNIVVQIDADRSDIRLDGMLRSGAKPRGPAVVLRFASKHGPLSYPCDTYDDWKANLRAIGLALAALRAVDRYGVTSHGEQYTGWARLPAPDQNGFANVAQAIEFICRVTRESVDLQNPEPILRRAEMLTHPDRGGNVEDFKRVQAARKMLMAGAMR